MARKGFVFRLSSEGLEELKRDLESLGPIGQKAFDMISQKSPQLANAMSRAESNLAKARAELEKLSRAGTPAFKALSAAGQEVDAGLRSMAARVPVVGGALSSLGPAGLAAAAGIGAVTIGIGKSITAFAEAERSVNRLNAVMRANGDRIGLTRKELAALQQEIKGNSFFGDGEVRAAQAALALNSGIRGQTFKEVIKLAADLSEVLGGDLSSNAVRLGKDLQDPVKGLTDLRKAGIDFATDADRAIKAMAEAGDKAGAGARLIDELKKSIGGAAAGSHEGAAGALDELSKNWGDFWENAGQRIADSGVMDYIKDINKSLAAMNAWIAGGGEIDPTRGFGAPRNPNFDLLQKRMQLGAVNDRLASAPEGPFRMGLLAQQRDLLKEIADLTDRIAAPGEVKRFNQALNTQQTNESIAGKAAASLKDQQEAAAELAKSQNEIIASMNKEVELAKMSNRERFIAETVARKVAELDGKPASPQLIADLERKAAAIYDIGKAQEEATRAGVDAEREQERQRKATADSIVGIQELISRIDDERLQLKMSSEQREIHTALLEAEAIARRANRKLTDEETRSIEASARARAREGEARKAAEEAQREAEGVMQDRQREMERIAEQQAEIMRRPWENALSSIQSSLTDFYEGVYSGSVDTFSEAAAAAKRIFVRLAAELTTLYTMRPIFGGALSLLGFGGAAGNLGLSPGVGGLGGGATFGSGTPSLGGGVTGGFSMPSMGGLGDIFGALVGPSNLYTPVQTLGNIGRTVGGAPTMLGNVANFLNTPLGGGLGSAALAFGASLLSGQGMLQSGVTAGLTGIGTAVGSIFGLGPIGGAVGGLLGSVIGGLLGKKKPKLKKNEAEAWLKAGTFGFPTIDYTDTDGKVRGGMGDELGDLAREAITLALANAGATLDPATRMRLSYYHSTKGGKTKSEFYKATMFADLKSLGLNNISGEISRYATVEDALKALSAGTLFATALQGNVAGTGASTQSAFRYLYTDGGKNKGAMSNVLTDVDKVMEVINFTKWVDGFDKVRTASDAAQKAVNDFNTSLAKFNAQAEELGISSPQVLAAMRRDFTETVAEELLQLTDPQKFALQQLEKDYAGRKAVAEKLGLDLLELEKLYGIKRQQVLDQGLKGVADTWKDFVNQLQFGELSALSPRDQLEQARLQYEAAKSIGGQEFRDKSGAYLSILKDFFGSTESYAKVFQEVIALAKKFGDIAGIPGFAQGGWHSGGLMFAGERGAELISTGPARVFNHKETAEILRQALGPKEHGPATWLRRPQAFAERGVAVPSGRDDVQIGMLSALNRFGKGIDTLVKMQKENNRDARISRARARE
jgi:hypothetical protein